VNVRRANHEDAETVAALLDEASAWVNDLGFSQWPLPFPHDQIADATDRGEVYVVEAEDGEPVAASARRSSSGRTQKPPKRDVSSSGSTVSATTRPSAPTTKTSASSTAVTSSPTGAS